jgi:four helix bundle protein
MKKDNVIKDKSYSFALDIIKLYKCLKDGKQEYLLSKQILRSGTSIGANVEEAVGAQTKKDFFSKMTIAYKEARETHYWLRLLKDSNYISENVSNDLLDKCLELIKIIGAIQKTIKNNGIV